MRGPIDQTLELRTGIPTSRRVPLVLIALLTVLGIGAAGWNRAPWVLDRGALAASEAARFPSDGRQAVAVADFTDVTAARDAFVAAQVGRPAGASLALFGQSLLTAVPSGDPRAAAWAAAATADASEVQPGRGATFAVSCTAADPVVAAALAQQAGDFFALPPALHLIPPWASPDRRPAVDRAHHQRARQTYRAAAAPVLVRAAATELGVLPAGPAGGAPDPRLQFASAGRVRASGRRVRVEGARFDDLFRGPAALVAWLRANGCADPRYRFTAG